jgi:prepilin-type N-terminal cleavage/methylation domain-containing protein
MTDIKRPRGERGFTLIETSIALLVMLVAGLGAASLFTYAINYNTGANDRAAAQALAQRRMEQLRKTAFGALESSTETVTNAGRSYTVQTAVCDDGSALCGGSTAFKRVAVTVTPAPAAGATWSRSSVVLVTLRSTTNLGPNFP